MSKRGADGSITIPTKHHKQEHVVNRASVFSLTVSHKRAQRNNRIALGKGAIGRKFKAVKCDFIQMTPLYNNISGSQQDKIIEIEWSTTEFPALKVTEALLFDEGIYSLGVAGSYYEQSFASEDVTVAGTVEDADMTTNQSGAPTVGIWFLKALCEKLLPWIIIKRGGNDGLLRVEYDNQLRLTVTILLRNGPAVDLTFRFKSKHHLLGNHVLDVEEVPASVITVDAPTVIRSPLNPTVGTYTHAHLDASFGHPNTIDATTADDLKIDPTTITSLVTVPLATSYCKPIIYTEGVLQDFEEEMALPTAISVALVDEDGKPFPSSVEFVAGLSFYNNA